MTNLGIINREKTAFILIDLQEKLLKVMQDQDNLIKNTNILVKSYSSFAVGAKVKTNSRE